MGGYLETMRVVTHVLVTWGLVGLAGLAMSQKAGDSVSAAPPITTADAGVCAGATPRPCPPEMVDVAGRFCIDRFEASVVDGSGRPLSPYYPPDPSSALRAFEHWSAVSEWEQLVACRHIDGGDDGVHLFVEQPEASACPGGWLDPDGGSCWQPRVLFGVPPLPPWQRSGAYSYRAVSRSGVLPNGYMSALTSVEACRAAGKRLCTESEWVTACRGESRTRHPYGDTFRFGVCNVHREAHPSVVLRGDWGAKLTDPRMNLTQHEGEPLLRKTGATPTCTSRWGDDAIYDMVGNLDEWVDNRAGLFVGGFYARATRNGCLARVWAHPAGHVDFSTGFRCCREVRAAPDAR